MCGIAGIVSKTHNLDSIMDKMLESIAHRGPDAKSSTRFDDVILGHRRLSIIDLDTGDQPIYNADKTLCIIYNGEVYNYKDIRKTLTDSGVIFRTQSDTEVVLKAYEKYGPKSVELLNGLFAYAIYNLKEKSLFIARDHFGIKPVHYYFKDNTFIFSSEQKAILQHPTVSSTINTSALHIHMNLRYTQGDQTLFKGIKRLPPAHYMILKDGKLSIKKYWELTPKVSTDMSEDEAIEGLQFHIKQAIKRQLVSDVPVGVYLSGGLDSSTIVQKMYELGVSQINTFTLGFNEPTDEFPDARRIAEHFNTNHREMSLSMNPLEEMEKVIWHAEEPKINLLQGFNMSKFVSPHVKVVLGGLGGDELFAGYDIHKFVKPTNKWHSRVPSWLQKLLRWKSDFLFKIQTASGTLRFDEYRRGLQMLLSIGKIERYYLIIRNTWDFDQPFYKKIYQPKYLAVQKEALPNTVEYFKNYFKSAEKFGALDQVLYTELHTKMVNDYLLVDDRMSMANSVEERVPFLDRDLVDYGFSIPIDLKIKNGTTKYLFRKAMTGKLPPKIIKKKKWGFTANPYLQFKKDLKQRVEQELTKEYIEAQGIFNYEYIEQILSYPAHPKLRWHYNYLWILLGLKVWEEVFSVDMKYN